MLNALKEIAGDEALGLIEEKEDSKVRKIVESWPTRLNTERANKLGFQSMGGLSEAIHDYVAEHGRENL